MMETGRQTEKCPMPAEAIRDTILRAARHAERILWEIVNNRSSESGKLEHGWGQRAADAEWLARRETGLVVLTDELGPWLGDDEGLEAAIAAERRRVREELDAKWLRPRTEEDGSPD